MTPEQKAWQNLRVPMKTLGLDPHRVENVIGPGHPDVDYTHGNIELKALDKFPARPTTPVEIPTLTGEQAGWLHNRWRAGGLAWLMVRVAGSAWYLFDGETSLAVYDGMTRASWEDRAAFVHPGGFVNGVRGWGAFPPGKGDHSYGRQLGSWLTWDLGRMTPDQQRRAKAMEVSRGRR